MKQLELLNFKHLLQKKAECHQPVNQTLLIMPGQESDPNHQEERRSWRKPTPQSQLSTILEMKTSQDHHHPPSLPSQRYQKSAMTTVRSMIMSMVMRKWLLQLILAVMVLPTGNNRCDFVLQSFFQTKLKPQLVLCTNNCKVYWQNILIKLQTC